MKVSRGLARSRITIVRGKAFSTVSRRRLRRFAPSSVAAVSAESVSRWYLVRSDSFSARALAAGLGQDCSNVLRHRSQQCSGYPSWNRAGICRAYAVCPYWKESRNERTKTLRPVAQTGERASKIKRVRPCRACGAIAPSRLRICHRARLRRPAVLLEIRAHRGQIHRMPVALHVSSVSTKFPLSARPWAVVDQRIVGLRQRA